jgi:uncharacterized glyoxalase superfamily protein PhnB
MTDDTSTTSTTAASTHAVSDIALWHSLTFRDPDAMMTWLAAVGFVEHATYRDDADPGVVVHAEWVWPGATAGLMFGSVRPESFVAPPGGSSAYLVVPDPDAVFDRAVAAGATVLQAMTDQGYGGRGGSVADPEGNTWSFGDYQPG